MPRADSLESTSGRQAPQAARTQRAGPVEPIGIPDRAAIRLACTHAIHAAIEIADFAYKQAGIDAIYPASPFERRFRDVHTLVADPVAHRALRDRRQDPARRRTRGFY